MVARRALSALVAAALGVAASGSGCSSEPTATSPGPSDAAAPDAAPVAVADAAPPLLPYPPGPYGTAVGDVVEDFVVDGYALSRDHRDARDLPFREISLGEVRSTPGCACMFVLINSLGTQCGFCRGAARTVTNTVLARKDFCALEVSIATFDGSNPEAQVGASVPTRADLDAYAQATRPAYPVGLATRSADLHVGASSIVAFPTAYAVRTSDMRVTSLLIGESDIASAVASDPCAEVGSTRTIATGLRPTGMVVVGSQAFVGDREAGIVRIDLASGARAVVAAPPAGSGRLASDAGYVYWGTTTGEIGRAPRDAVAPAGRQVLAQRDAAITALLLDGDALWFATKTGEIGSVPAAGGEVTTLLTGEIEPRALAVDATTAYWTTSTREVFSKAKTGGVRTFVRRVAPPTLASPTPDLAQLVELRISGTSTLDVLMQSIGLYRISRSPSTDAPQKLVEIGGIWSTTPIAGDQWAVVTRAPPPATDPIGVVGRADPNGFPFVAVGQWRAVSAYATGATSTLWLLEGEDPDAGTGMLREVVREPLP